MIGIVVITMTISVGIVVLAYRFLEAVPQIPIVSALLLKGCSTSAVGTLPVYLISVSSLAVISSGCSVG